jgi:LEA14-like dessication related protein
MARQNINIGSSANDGTGDPLRTAFDKINDNFIELYGTDNDINTLDANLDVNNFAITTGVTNGDVTITPNGTGNINLGSITINGSTVSANDSTQITLAENIQTTGTLNVSGAVTIGGATTISTSLALASGATVTSILDEDAMGSDSATALATQQSIKAYVDAQVTASDLDFQGDSGGALSVDLDSQTFTVAGGTGIDTAGSGQTLTVNIDSSVVTLTGSQTLTNKVLTSPTISSPTITGVTTTTSLTTNDITSNGSNANITINPQGTGTIELSAATNVTGSASVSGTLSTADITTTGNQTISGSLTTGTFNVGDLNINADGKISTDTNGNIDLDPSGTGAINLTGPTNIIGTATVTGQLNVDNLRMDANTISSTSGGITISPAVGETLALGGTDRIVTATEFQATLAEITTLRADTIQNDTSDGDISISTQGTGVIDLNTATQSTVGSAGGANALPATPTGYIKIKIAGTMRVIPFYDEA